MAAEDSIFISYRRNDSQDVTGRICDRLKAHFGSDAVFIDDTIPYGADFPNHLRQTLKDAKVLLAVIGPTWMDELRSRLEKPEIDWVRLELEQALSQKDTLVIPVLVNGAEIPTSSDLPAELQAFPRKNAAKARAGTDFDTDLERLIGRIASVFDANIPSRLAPQQMKGLQDALLAAFPEEDEFAMLVQFSLGTALNRISRARTYDKLIFDVIQWVNSRNKVSELVNGSLNTNPDSVELLQFIGSLS